MLGVVKMVELQGCFLQNCTQIMCTNEIFLAPDVSFDFNEAVNEKVHLDLNFTCSVLC